MAGIVIPSATIAFITWAKGTTVINTVFGGRIAASNPAPGFPYLLVTRITGIPQIAEAPIDFARLQLNVWGGTKPNGQPDWAKADEPARIIEAEIRAFRGAKVNDDAYISELSPFEGMQQLEDPVTHDARFWMDALAVVRRADGQ